MRVLLVMGLVMGLLGCSPDDPNRRLDEDYGPKPLFDPFGLPTSSIGAVLPVPIDLFFGQDPASNDNPDDDIDGTLAPKGSLAALPNWGQIDGWSTTAALFFNLQGSIDIDSAAQGIRIFDSARAQELVAGEDFSLQLSHLSLSSPRIVINWLKPLKESTKYLIGVTTELRGREGGAAIPNELFHVLNQAKLFSEQTAPTDPGASLQASLNAFGRADLIPQLDNLQTSYIQPVVGGLQALAQQAPNSRGPLLASDLILAWSFTTQSISPTLKAINDTAQPRTLVVQDSKINLSDALSLQTGQTVVLPPEQDPDLYGGGLSLPYYSKAGAEEILSAQWINDGQVNPDGQHPALGIPCAAIPITPLSTTLCHPNAKQQDQVMVPVLLSRPQSEMPEGGWPIVVFLHGITQDRSNLLGIAGALSAAGLVGIAIDHPLHGLAAGSPLRVPGTTERTFDADLDQDGTIDASGTHFINLPNPITSRDNLRQSVADQIHLIRSLENLRIGPAADETVNLNRIYFLGHSLGGIVGATLLGVNDDIQAASLAMPGGGIAKLLDASPTFGPAIAAGLSAAGIERGTDSFEIFLRFAQLAVDAGDPINWALGAADKRPLHLIEVINDQVVPNDALAGVELPGTLSGTRPLATTQGLNATTITPPLTESEQQILSGSQWIQFEGGNHSSVLQPETANPLDDPVFLEMQRQIASFLASHGTCLPLGTNCPSGQ